MLIAPQTMRMAAVAHYEPTHNRPGSYNMWERRLYHRPPQNGVAIVIISTSSSISTDRELFKVYLNNSATLLKDLISIISIFHVADCLTKSHIIRIPRLQSPMHQHHSTPFSRVGVPFEPSCCDVNVCMRVCDFEWRTLHGENPRVLDPHNQAQPYVQLPDEQIIRATNVRQSSSVFPCGRFV